MVVSFLLSFLLLFSNDNSIIPKKADKITIVVVDGKAFLADVDNEGKVLKKYMEIQGDVDVNKNLDEQVKKATEEYKRRMELEKDQIRFIAYDLIGEDDLGDLALNHLQELSNHYNNSYANHFVITLGKRKGNEDFLKQKELLIVNSLIKFNIPKEDIDVEYKWDRGSEPTQFIKIKTGLRELPQI